MQRRKTKRNKKKLILIIALFAIVLLIFLQVRFSLSRYIYNAIRSYYFSSKGFYFNCDKLAVEPTEFEIKNNWSGAETYVITINLNSKKNDAVFAEVDIDYKVKISSSKNIECTLSKDSGTIVGSANSGINEDYFTIAVNPATGKGLAYGETAWVDVEVTSTSPYVEILSGRLIVGVGVAGVGYEIADSEDNPYIEVIITNSLVDKQNVTLEFDPKKVLIDMTDNFVIKAKNIETEEINNYQYVYKATSEIKPLETYKVRFYKVDPSMDYSYEMGGDKESVVTLTY